MRDGEGMKQPWLLHPRSQCWALESVCKGRHFSRFLCRCKKLWGLCSHLPLKLIWTFRLAGLFSPPVVAHQVPVLVGATFPGQVGRGQSGALGSRGRSLPQGYCGGFRSCDHIYVGGKNTA